MANFKDVTFFAGSTTYHQPGDVEVSYVKNKKKMIKTNLEKILQKPQLRDQDTASK